MLQVYLFEFPLRRAQDLKYIRVLDGTQMGEYFGGAVCVVDLNGDHLDDLVVAAPQFSLQAANSEQLVGDEGRIYVFINYDDVSRKLHLCLSQSTLSGHWVFGTVSGHTLCLL
jgi:hypothetical protein